MTRHAVETAMALVESDTYSLELAATAAGTTPERLRATLDRRGVDVERTSQERSRTRVAAD